MLELTLWPYVIFLFYLFTISVQVNLSALKKMMRKIDNIFFNTATNNQKVHISLMLIHFSLAIKLRQ